MCEDLQRGFSSNIYWMVLCGAHWLLGWGAELFWRPDHGLSASLTGSLVVTRGGVEAKSMPCGHRGQVCSANWELPEGYGARSCMSVGHRREGENVFQAEGQKYDRSTGRAGGSRPFSATVGVRPRWPVGRSSDPSLGEQC